MQSCRALLVGQAGDSAPAEPQVGNKPCSANSASLHTLTRQDARGWLPQGPGQDEAARRQPGLVAARATHQPSRGRSRAPNCCLGMFSSGRLCSAGTETPRDAHRCCGQRLSRRRCPSPGVPGMLGLENCIWKRDCNTGEYACTPTHSISAKKKRSGAKSCRRTVLREGTSAQGRHPAQAWPQHRERKEDGMGWEAAGGQKQQCRKKWGIKAVRLPG